VGTCISVSTSKSCAMSLKRKRLPSNAAKLFCTKYWPKILKWSVAYNFGCGALYYMPWRVTVSSHQVRVRSSQKGWGGAISEIFGSQVSLRVLYCKKDDVYFTNLLRQNNGRQNGLTSQMLFSYLYKIIVNKVTFVGFRASDRAPGCAPASGSMQHCFFWGFIVKNM